MKLKKILSTLLIILIGSVGLLFGCDTKPLKLSVMFQEQSVSKITLNLPISKEDEIQNPDKYNKSAQIKIVAENSNSVFDKGLYYNVSEPNIISVSDPIKDNEGYIYNITATNAKNVTITFETHDKKTSVSLFVEILQGIEKIEPNIMSENYLVLGQDKVLSNTIVSYKPSTTTDKEVFYEFSEGHDYKGITLENNVIKFDEGVTTVLDGEDPVNKIYITAKHNKYVEPPVEPPIEPPVEPQRLEEIDIIVPENNENFIIRNIEFDILQPVDKLVAVTNTNGFYSDINSLSFATNLSEEMYNFQTISLKRLIYLGGRLDYFDVDDTYELTYRLKDAVNDIVSIEPDSQDKFTITVSQNFRTGENVLILQLVNTLQPNFKSQEIELPIDIKTYPSYINVNGVRNPEEIVLYDNGSSKELEIVVGNVNSFNTDFEITSFSSEYLQLKYSSGIEVLTNNAIKSGTKLYLSVVENANIPNGNHLIEFDIRATATRYLSTPCTTTVKVRIVKNLADATISLNNQTSTSYSISKLDQYGRNNIVEFDITADAFIPAFNVEVENENIVQLEHLDLDFHKFELKALTSGSTVVKVKFDNGLEKEFTINVFTPVSYIMVDVDDYTKNNNLGEIVYSIDDNPDSLTYNKNILSEFALKQNLSAKLTFNSYDTNKNLINERTIYSVEYEVEGNNENIVVSNIDNTITGLKKTLSDITITVKIKAYDISNTLQTYVTSFKVSVYIPINTITLNESYISLYTLNSVGYAHSNLAKANLFVSIEPANASEYSISYNANFTNDVVYSVEKIAGQSSNLMFTAIDLTEGASIRTGTITFSIQEFGVIYTRRVTVNITNAIKPETVLVDNVEKQTKDGVVEDYLYFNLGYTEDIKISPRVYPLNSYDINYDVRIENLKNCEADPIKFDKINGVVSAKTVGECDLVLIPIAAYTDDNNNYNPNLARRIHITVADGDLIPYAISTKEDFLALSTTKVIENADISSHLEKYTKKYILINDIDLTGESILPIGIYKTKEFGGLEQYNIAEFTGSFSGQFTVGDITLNYSINNISFNIEYGTSLNLLKVDTASNAYETYIGLFAKNKGIIENLNVYYSDISANLSSVVNPKLVNRPTDNVTTLYFGGIAGINYNIISNCNVTINNANISTYLKDNKVGFIAGKNENLNRAENIGVISCKANGSLNIVDASIVEFAQVPAQSNILAGGLVGENNVNAEIISDFVVNNQTQLFNKDFISSTVNLTSLYNGELVVFTTNSAFGGIAGLNKGKISQVSSYAKIYAYANLGGITGKNENEIDSCFVAPHIWGNNTIGGLSGLQSGNTNIKNNLIMFLEDNEVIKTNNYQTKILAENFVGGLFGKFDAISLDETKIFNNFVKTYVDASSYADIFVQKDDSNFGALVGGMLLPSLAEYVNGKDLLGETSNVNYSKINIKVVENNIATYIYGQQDIGIIAPTSLSVSIKDSTLTESYYDIYNYNKFIKANDNSIVVFYHEGENVKKYNKFLHNYIFNITSNYPDGTLETKKLSLIKIESLNTDVLKIDNLGNFEILKSGQATISVYSLLNKKAKAEINIIALKAIEEFKIYEDSLCLNEIEETLTIEKDRSLNLYLTDNVKQENLFVKYLIDGENATNNEYILINSNDSEFYKTSNAQILHAVDYNTVLLTAQLYVKAKDGSYLALPLISNFNVSVKQGLQNIYSNIVEAELVTNSSLDLKIEAVTDLQASTYFVVEQYYIENTTKKFGEYLKYSVIKEADSESVNYDFKLSIDDSYLEEIENKSIYFKIYIYDSFVSVTEIKGNETIYSKYIKTIKIDIKENVLMNADISYFADGETRKNELGHDVFNFNELESNFIKIGKVGVLKINIYPIQNLTKSLKVTYTNSDNLNLNFKQIRKVSTGNYVDVSTATLIHKGIILDINEQNIDESYLYLKLLTDSPIREGSKFVLKIEIDDYPFYFEKTLTSRLASNLEIDYNNAIMNSEGKLEGVYAKGVKNQQIVSLTVSKLSEYPYKVELTSSSGANSPSINLINKENLANEVVRYNFSLDGLNKSGTENGNEKNEFVEISFYVDKIVNGKIERFTSQTLKLNIVDFVVNSFEIENVEDAYINKPFGSGYPLKVHLNTTYNGDIGILANIEQLEKQISQSAIWYLNNSKLESGKYPLDNDNKLFEVYKDNNFYGIKPLTAFKGQNLSANFAVLYNNGAVEFESVNYQTESNIPYFNSNIYSHKFKSNFGLNFYMQNDINNPVPIYTQEEFENMQDGANYILLNDLVLENYSPKQAKFKTFDGNSHLITISSFNIDLTQIKSEFEFGLFSEIGEDSLVKNVNLRYLPNLSNGFVTTNADVLALNLINIETLYFGALAGINNGLIYNCNIQNINQTSVDVLGINTSNILNENQTKSYIGGFVGQNNGIITNSRSFLKLKVNKGFVAGFVSENNGTISSSFVKNVFITNSGEDETTSATAGFVYKNQGNINFSFVEGDNSVVDNGRLLTDKIQNNKRLYCLTAPTSIGGFVYNNTGNINDCYSNLSITSQSFSGGFVFENTGAIDQCYTATKNELEENTAHAPFIAIKNITNVDNVKKGIINCFYLNIDKTSINDDFVKGLSLEQFNDDYYFTNFVFDDENSIWFSRENLTPTLTEANNIAVSKRSLAGTKEVAGNTVYEYIYDAVDGGEIYFRGHRNNPTIISNEEEFISYFTTNSANNNYYYRLINNIDFSEYSNLPTINTTFSGRLDGNGLKISNMSISAPSGFNNSSFGLFASIEQLNSSEFKPVVKNLTITPIEVYANNVQIVGTLAGTVKNANLINIDVVAGGVIVQGKNIVGGVAGLVLGDSSLINITSNISVNANYICKEDQGKYLYVSEGDNTKVSYSGSICGVIDVENDIDNPNERVRNIKVNNGAKTIADISGLAFGFVGVNSGVDDIKVYVDATSYVNSIFAGGLVVGENRGYLSRVETLYYSATSNESVNEEVEASRQKISLFRNKSSFIGGIVGFNNDGSVVNSIARVGVVSSNASTRIAGGVIGLSVGGRISSVYAVNNVELISSGAIGGLIGITARKDMLSEERNKDIKINEENVEKTINNNNIVYIANCVLDNKFSSEALSFLASNIEDREYIIGAIIGAIHNTTSSDSGGLGLTNKNSYIAENNYYKKQFVEKIVKEGEEETIYNYYLLDFGGSNILDLTNLGATKNVITGLKNGKNVDETNFEKYKEVNSAQVVEEINIDCFKTWSNNVFNIISNDNRELLSISLKNINNINTKKLVGQGTFMNPYLIESIYSINQLANLVNDGENQVYVNLIDNVDVTGKTFISIGNSLSPFNGTFNGNNFYINGLTYFNSSNNYTENYYGLFGYVGNTGNILNLNVVASFVINYGSRVQYTGVIAGFNRGYISNCNVYGGLVCVLQNINNSIENNENISVISYIGGVVGANAGRTGSGIISSNNYAIIYITASDEEIENTASISSINIYAGFIVGANLQNSVINRCYNYSIKNLALNQGAEDYTLIVINARTAYCNNYVGNMCGFADSTSVVNDTTAENAKDVIFSI